STELVPTELRWQSETDWRRLQPITADGKFDLGEPASVQDDVVRGVRDRLAARGVPEARSDGFQQQLGEVDMRETIVALDVDGVLAPNRWALVPEMVDTLVDLGKRVEAG